MIFIATEWSIFSHTIYSPQPSSQTQIPPFPQWLDSYRERNALLSSMLECHMASPWSGPRNLHSGGAVGRSGSTDNWREVFPSARTHTHNTHIATSTVLPSPSGTDLSQSSAAWNPSRVALAPAPRCCDPTPPESPRGERSALLLVQTA